MGSGGSTALTAQRSESMILGFGQETSENVKIALPCKRQLNFQGSGTLEKRNFLVFVEVKFRVLSGTHQIWLKNGFPGFLGAPWEGSKGENGCHRGPP